jgi:hypothetical protein
VQPSLSLRKHFHIQLGQAGKILNGYSFVLMSVNVNEADLDQQAILEAADSTDEISMFGALVHFKPVTNGTVYPREIVTANGDHILRYVVESANGSNAKENSVDAL